MSVTTTALIRDRALAPLASDIPEGMTVGEYRRLRTPARHWWRARALPLDQVDMDRLDEEVDHGFALLAAALAQATRSNMQEQAERFTEALDADAVLPEEF